MCVTAFILTFDILNLLWQRLLFVRLLVVLLFFFFFALLLLLLWLPLRYANVARAICVCYSARVSRNNEMTIRS